MSCPTLTVQLDGTPHTIVGCGSTNTRQTPDEPGIWDCLDCGIWFQPALEVLS